MTRRLTSWLQPSTIVFLYYLIINSVMERDGISILEIIAYSTIGIMVIPFVMRAEWGYFLWFFAYLLGGIPVFYFYLPIYSLWNMDDLSWGKTREVAETTNEVSPIQFERDRCIATSHESPQSSLARPSSTTTEMQPTATTASCTATCSIQPSKKAKKQTKKKVLKECPSSDSSLSLGEVFAVEGAKKKTKKKVLKECPSSDSSLSLGEVFAVERASLTDMKPPNRTKNNKKSKKKKKNNSSTSVWLSASDNSAGLSVEEILALDFEKKPKSKNKKEEKNDPHSSTSTDLEDLSQTRSCTNCSSLSSLSLLGEGDVVRAEKRKKRKSKKSKATKDANAEDDVDDSNHAEVKSKGKKTKKKNDREIPP
jgi:hypothetical protein